MTTIQSLNVGSTVNASSVYYDAMRLNASNAFSVSFGNTVSYVVTTGVPNGAAQVVVAGEEDLADIVESDRAMAEARHRGTRSWRKVKKELGL